jgi:tetratricopeptide (TPR) repeat protein
MFIKKIIFVLFCSFMSLSTLAMAQESDPVKLFSKGETYYNAGEWELALKNYKEAYIISNEPALLYNMAQCYRQMNKYDDAIRTYKNFLKEMPDTNLRPTVEAFITELEAKKSAPVDPVVVPPTSMVTTVTPVVTPVVTPTSAALVPATKEDEKPATHKKIFLFAGIGGGVVLAGVIAGVALSHPNEEPQSTLGTFRPFPL